jgi:hypothetical protein
VSGREAPWERLRSLEMAALRRARGERVPVPDARAAVCEVCGGTNVHWGALCEPCRERLNAAGRRRG